MTLAPGTKVGSYEILAPLGAGGMGEVYRARDARVDRAVALKVLPEEFLEGEERRERFGREARLLASLNHPGIATLYSFEEIPGSSSRSSSARNVLTMELVEGSDLAQLLSSGPLPLEESLSLARQIAEALEAAHEKGIVHRDLKPANVKVTPDGRVKLLDFGLAKIFEGDGDSPKSGPGGGLTQSPTLTARATAAGIILGTAAYMSPEQARGKTVDKRTDVWAFGCVLYEMLTGQRAFEGETVSDTLAAVLMREPDWAALPAAAPERIKEILRKCLRRDARLRLRDIGDARLDLEELSSSGATSSSGQLPFEEKTALPSPTVGRSASPRVERGSRSLVSLLLPWTLAAAFAAAAGALALRARAPQRAAVIRSTIGLPPGVQFRSENASVALSRDGKRLVFAAAAGGSRPRLWVRSLDSFAAQALEGTDDATEPFFSPDGQNIAFFAERKLKRVPAAGGTVQTLCAVPDARGGTWGDSDVIVFSPAPFGGLKRVPASGGTPEELTPTVDKVTSDRMPVFVPGTDRVLFFHGSELNAKTNGIFVVDLASKRITPVVAENGRPLVAPGALVFPRPGGRLLARRFDASSLKVSGEPVTLVEQAWFNLNRWTPNAAVSGTGLLVVEPMAASEKCRLTWLDLQGRSLGAVGEPGLINGAVVAPDGRRALVVKPDDTGGAALWIVDLERGVSSRFTPEYSYDPIWSADGKLAAYSDENGNVWVKATDGLTEPRKVVSYVSTNQRPTSFTPDGATLLLDRQTSEGWRVLSVPVTGGEARLATESHSSDQLGRVSPDGKWLAWLTDDTGRSEVYVMPWPKGERRQISSSGAENVFWLGRSGDLAWIQDGQLFASRIGAAEPGPVRPLLGGPILASARAVAPAPDGARILAALPVGGASSGSLTLIANWPSELGRR